MRQRSKDVRSQLFFLAKLYKVQKISKQINILSSRGHVVHILFVCTYMYHNSLRKHNNDIIITSCARRFCEHTCTHIRIYAQSYYSYEYLHITMYKTHITPEHCHIHEDMYKYINLNVFVGKYTHTTLICECMTVQCAHYTNICI